MTQATGWAKEHTISMCEFQSCRQIAVMQLCGFILERFLRGRKSGSYPALLGAKLLVSQRGEFLVQQPLGLSSVRQGNRGSVGARGDRGK